MIPLGLSARQLAKEIDVPPNRITEIIRARRDVSADTAIRLGRRFGTTLGERKSDRPRENRGYAGHPRLASRSRRSGRAPRHSARPAAES